MHKILRYSLLAGSLLLLLTFGSCAPQASPTAVSPALTDAPLVASPDPGPAATNTDGAQTILIPAGTFLMGSNETDPLGEADELPAHQVMVNSFHLYTHEVTNEMYALCVAAGQCAPVNELTGGPTAHTSDPAFAQYPVVGVTWNMADAYCTYAGARLPTEAEWEYAARGADSLLYPWGADQPACDRANMDGCQTPADTVAVGTYALGNSPFGLWDMSGNVWEWTNDWYAESFYFFSPADNPLGPGMYQDPENPLKVARGGGLYSDAARMRAAARLGLNPYRAYNDVGFRCVAEAPLPLPDDYLDTSLRVEATGEAGENAEEPGAPLENWFDVMYAYATCPYNGDQIRMDLRLDAPAGTDYAVSVAGAAFDCAYDPPFNVYRCTGPAPAGYTELPKFPVDIVATFPDGTTADDPSLYIGVPQDCAGSEDSHPDSASVSCPLDGSVTATFTYDPADVTWQEVYLRSQDTPLPCEVTGEGVLTCIAPDILTDGYYAFYMYGENEAGLGRKRWPDVPPPAGCPADTGPFTVGVETPCFLDDIPTAKFYYDVDVHGSVKTVQDAGEYRLHVNWSPGVTQAMFTDETPGLVTTMTLCFQDGFCMDVPDITVPACPAVGISAITYGYTLEPGCFAPGSEVVFDPAVNIHYWPTNQQVVSATANGAALTCNPVVDGWTNCSILPGQVGDSVDVNFCFADGACYDGATTVRDCPDATQSEWTFVGSGCHPVPDPDYVYIMVDTGYEWLTADADVSYTATDGIRVFSCVTHPSYPGRIYCYGLKPTQPETMNICLQQPGQPSDCRSFPGYLGWVSGLTCSGVVTPTCSSYSNQSSCQSNGCTWVPDPVSAGPPTGKCKD